ncbi:PREDICTED: uncharacterized protein LOC106303279 [Brassica oleracea var. oleracea]|uniref:uncharacterized protein LOC106303279 n=1 Tax=Brassica oleracea var. oleracea TaxID=109376 RepID=UPI0006A707C2|nr:PREDICTED: uncharacterized protein LOC106303279 [Brassica oleracea var. oleracea]
MGIHTLRCKSGKKVRDVLLDEKATEKAKNPPRGTRRRIKIILTRKQLELLLLNSAEGVSSKLPKTYGSCKRKWKPSLQTIVEKPSQSPSSQAAFIIVLSFNISLSLDQQEMEIQARLMEYKFHVMITIIVIVVLSSLVYAAPRILDILAYFWPLFASTAAFLAMAITSGGFQQLSDEATGEGIMDYVAGRPEDSYKYN